jgi:hypothetical protein
VRALTERDGSVHFHARWLTRQARYVRCLSVHCSCVKLPFSEILTTRDYHVKTTGGTTEVPHVREEKVLTGTVRENGHARWGRQTIVQALRLITFVYMTGGDGADSVEWPPRPGPQRTRPSWLSDEPSPSSRRAPTPSALRVAWPKLADARHLCRSGRHGDRFSRTTSSIRHAGSRIAARLSTLLLPFALQVGESSLPPPPPTLLVGPAEPSDLDDACTLDDLLQLDPRAFRPVLQSPPQRSKNPNARPLPADTAAISARSGVGICAEGMPPLPERRTTETGFPTLGACVRVRARVRARE